MTARNLGRDAGLGSWVTRRERRSPYGIAVVEGDREITFADLAGRVARAARALRGLGVRRGDRVAYLGPNHSSFLEVLFGAASLGAIFVPLDTRLAAPELAFILADSGASVLLYAPQQAAQVYDLRTTGPLRHRIALGAPLTPGDHSYGDLLDLQQPEPLAEPVGLDDTCMIMYTSGTTGRPKGARLTHGNLTWNSVNLLLDADLRADDVTLVNAPMCHAAPLHQAVLPTFLKGGRSVLVPSFDPAGTLELIARHRVTVLVGTPAGYAAVAAAPGWAAADLSGIRTMIVGGAPVPAALAGTYTRRGLAFLASYGMTETSPGALFLRAEDALTHPGSAGTPAFFADVRLRPPTSAAAGRCTPGGAFAATSSAVSRGVAAGASSAVSRGVSDGVPGDGLDGVLDGAFCGPGTVGFGEIVVQGPTVMAGYWGRPEDTAAVLSPDGWLRSGDLATVDADGYFRIRDRVRDMFVSGGRSVCPGEVEEALRGHPAVSECVVIGVPDRLGGEAGRAFVVLRPGAGATAEDLLASLDGRIARHKIPRSVVVIDEMPRAESGKILKSHLRRALATTAPESRSP